MLELLHTPWIAWTTAAGVISCVALAALFRGLWRRINTAAFLAQVNKLILVGNSVRAVKLCNIVPGTRVARLTLFMLGLELSARGPAPDQAARGYREAAPAPDFAATLHNRITSELAALRREVQRMYGLALLLQIAAFAAGATALLTYAYASLNTTHIWPFIVTLVPLLGTVSAISIWRTERGALSRVKEALLPHMRPAEEMDRDRLDAAAAARKLYPGSAAPTAKAAPSL